MLFLMGKDVIYTIDEIYNLFIWDPSLSPEENEARIARGMALAAKVRYLYPFIQPMLPGHSKSAWDPCARVLAARSDDELEPHLYQLFEWLQDRNWPGADIIWDRLLRFPFSRLESFHSLACTVARRTDDEVWLEVLEDFRKEARK